MGLGLTSLQRARGPEGQRARGPEGQRARGPGSQKATALEDQKKNPTNNPEVQSCKKSRGSEQVRVSYGKVRVITPNVRVRGAAWTGSLAQ
jgi:hypothetical protein